MGISDAGKFDASAAVHEIFLVVVRLCSEGALAAIAGDEQTLSDMLEQAEALLAERALHSSAAWPDAALMS